MSDGTFGVKNIGHTLFDGTFGAKNIVLFPISGSKNIRTKRGGGVRSITRRSPNFFEEYLVTIKSIKF